MTLKAGGEKVCEGGVGKDSGNSAWPAGKIHGVGGKPAGWCEIMASLYTSKYNLMSLSGWLYKASKAWQDRDMGNTTP